MSTINGIDYGPLAPLLGKWVGTRGLDKAPDGNGEPDRTPFIDELTFEVAGAAENAEEQELVAIPRRQLERLPGPRHEKTHTRRRLVDLEPVELRAADHDPQHPRRAGCGPYHRQGS